MLQRIKSSTTIPALVVLLMTGCAHQATLDRANRPFVVTGKTQPTAALAIIDCDRPRPHAVPTRLVGTVSKPFQNAPKPKQSLSAVKQATSITRRNASGNIQTAEALTPQHEQKSQLQPQSRAQPASTPRQMLAPQPKSSGETTIPAPVRQVVNTAPLPKLVQRKSEQPKPTQPKLLQPTVSSGFVDFDREAKRPVQLKIPSSMKQAYADMWNPPERGLTDAEVAELK